MIVLAIDTATADLVCGVVNTATGESHEQVLPGARGHNEQLIPAVHAALASAGREFADLEAVVVGEGPGPFTSLRIGMATASAIAQALELPVYGVTTHDAIARRAHREYSELLESHHGDLAVVTDARRREAYWALYRDGQRVSGPEVSTPQEVPSAAVVSVPDQLAEHFVDSQRLDLTPRAMDLVDCADLYSRPETPRPQYLRRPDAQVPAPKPPSPAIPKIEI